jgi:hypothetical protein
VFNADNGRGIGAVMGKEETTDRVKRQLCRAIDSLRHDLTRVEILSAALCAFNRPVPSYDPVFYHLRKPMRGAHELDDERRDS